MKYRITQLSRIYENSIGEPAKLVMFKGRIKKYYLCKPDGTKLTPLLDSIKYDRESEAFLVTHSYHDVYEDGRPSTTTDTVSFYIDFKGNPISQGYTNYLDQNFPIKFSDERVPNDDQWFLEFGVTLRNIGICLGKEIDRRNNNKMKQLKAQ